MRVVFAGTPEFAAVALRQLLDAGHTVPLVLTQPDRPAGRGLKLQPSPVKQVALAHGIPVLQPRSLRLEGKYPEEAAAAQAALMACAPQVMVVAAYGLILPRWTLVLPPLGCLNIHASLLPRWRGAAPIHRAIEAGDRETGITLMQMDEGLDTGPMLRKATLAIAPEDTTASLHDRLADLGGRLLCKVLDEAAAGPLSPQPQPEAGVTYAHKIEKAEGQLDWRAPAALLARRVRAFTPAPGAFFRLGAETIKCGDAYAEASRRASAPGEVLQADAQGVVVACGEGVLRLLSLQRAGGKRLPAGDFLRGFPLQVGQILDPVDVLAP